MDAQKLSSVVEVDSDEAYDAILATAGDRLVVVDFSAVWCGPCKAIAPIFASLSMMYPNVSFLKVDTDKLVLTAQRNQIRAVPTFKFFRNNQQLHEIQGAQSAELETFLRIHGSAPVAPKPQEQKSPFTYFPVSTWLIFEASKMDPIKSKLFEFNVTLSQNNNTKDHGLTGGEIKAVSTVFETLAKTSHYHSSKFDAEAYAVILKVIRWPLEYRFPALDVLRLMVLHPEAAAHFAKTYHEGHPDNVVDIIFSYLLQEGLPVGVSTMLWRFVGNMFAHEPLRTVAEQNIDQIAAFATPFTTDKSVPVRIAVAAALLNGAELARRKQSTEIAEVIGEAAMTWFPLEEDQQVKDRLLSTIGTLAFGFPAKATQFKQHEVLSALLAAQKATSVAANEVATLLSK